ncbi:MAG: hypothetical protein IJ449_05550 [Clostridia bacterium]|nr:hypothetical protein [Clostridia bacterium]
MRVVVRTPQLPVPIPVLFPSLLLFNHLTAVIGLVVLLILQVCGKRLPSPLTPWKCFFLFHRFIFAYWKCRILHPGWKLVDVHSADADVTVKL